MPKIIKLTESDLTRIVRRVINEQPEVSDLDRKQLSDKMIKDVIDKYYLDDVVDPKTKVPYQPFNNGGKLDYNKAYREHMESIDEQLVELGFPNGVHIPENISRQEFDALKTKWEQSVSRLEESDLTRIVRRVIIENEENNYDFDFSQTDNKLLSDFFTVKNNFEYSGNKNGMEIYVLRKRGYSVMAVTKPSNQPSEIDIMVFLSLPQGKRINYLEEVHGRNSITLPINDYNKMTRILQGAVDFGRAQSDYDNMEPLPKF